VVSVLNQTVINVKNEEMKPKFGDIFYANLKEDGCIQGGIRPVIIVQNNIGNKHSPTIVVIPLTSKTDKARYMPTHVLIESSPSGLAKDSITLVEQPRSINMSDIVGKKITVLDTSTLKKVGVAWNIQFPFPS